jgi:Metallo-peptidase family M12B Reprolysin-like
MERIHRHRRIDRRVSGWEGLESRQHLSADRQVDATSLAMPAGCGCAACTGAKARATDLVMTSFKQIERETNLFRSVLSPEASPNSDRSQLVRPTNAAMFSIDWTSLRSTLDQAPLEGSSRDSKPLSIDLPTPGGDLARFNIQQYSMMEPALAEAFPQIKTYRGVGVDGSSIYLDQTPQGFHASVIDPKGGNWYLDPVFHLEAGGSHMAYYRADAQLTAANRAWQCHTVADAVDTVGADQDQDASPAEALNGNTRRVYRLAVSATGEYTTFHGGTVALGQAAIVTAINRINQVYGYELEIGFTLVANNQNIVYTNSSTDPFTNSDGIAMLSQNQSTIDSVIGSANYDLGHVFSTGGGGVASLGVLGVNGSKARGVTGSFSPINDPFVIDYVAHEMGHQLNALHTFNSTSGSCGGGNRDSSAAFEPGSGSTIMSYAGICGSDNLQSNSDAFFHSFSLEQIWAHLNSRSPSLGAPVASGNAAPRVSITGPTSYTIPARSYFQLAASATDADNNPITYSWEQRDLGTAATLSSTFTANGPLFRVRNPSANGTRVFPQLSNILANTTNNQEKLPTVGRTMNFTVYVRDGQGGVSNFNSAGTAQNVALTVVDTGAKFDITNFNSASSVVGGTSQTINWNVAGTNANGINTANVRILFSTDGGQTFPIVLAASEANDGSATVTMPFTPGTTQGRFKIEGVDNVFFDITNANTTLVASVGSPTPNAPTLSAGSDTGTSSSDLLTKLNNASPTDVLTFNVTNTVAGATVELLYAGNVIGTAVATGTSTAVTTNGSLAIPDGAAVFTARQTAPSQPMSLSSPSTTVTVDTVAPTVSSMAYDREVTQDITVVFGEPLTGVTPGAISLTNTITSTNVASSAVNVTSNTAVFGFPALLANGIYSASVSGLTDVAGNALAPGTPLGFRQIAGDANDDGAVDFADLLIVAQNYDQLGTFSDGNFDYLTTVNFADLLIVAQNYEQPPFLRMEDRPAPGAAVLEEANETV